MNGTISKETHNILYGTKAFISINIKIQPYIGQFYYKRVTANIIFNTGMTLNSEKQIKTLMLKRLP